MCVNHYAAKVTPKVQTCKRKIKTAYFHKQAASKQYNTFIMNKVVASDAGYCIEVHLVEGQHLDCHL